MRLLTPDQMSIRCGGQEEHSSTALIVATGVERRILFLDEGSLVGWANNLREIADRLDARHEELFG